jgi:16S rRNA (guanine527-N7)-methyltransferase
VTLSLTARQTADLKHYEELLRKWQRTINLVGPSTLSHIWTRHFEDSAQLYRCAPQARHWIDLGSGGGFPGLVIAMLGKEAGLRVDLVESDARKAAFLRTVSRETETPAMIHHGRIETVLPTLGQPDVVSARALAPLRQLLDWTAPVIAQGAMGVFLKGQDVDVELKEVANYSNFIISKQSSQTDPRASIVQVTRARQPDPIA